MVEGERFETVAEYVPEPTKASLTYTELYPVSPCLRYLKPTFCAAFSVVTPEKDADRVAPVALFSTEPVSTEAVRFPPPEVPPPDPPQL